MKKEQMKIMPKGKFSMKVVATNLVKDDKKNCRK